MMPNLHHFIFQMFYYPPGRVVPSANPLCNLMEDPAVKEIAAKYGKTPAQVLIRHLVDNGIAVIPKSVKQVLYFSFPLHFLTGFQ